MVKPQVGKVFVVCGVLVLFAVLMMVVGSWVSDWKRSQKVRKEQYSISETSIREPSQQPGVQNLEKSENMSQSQEMSVIENSKNGNRLLKSEATVLSKVGGKVSIFIDNEDYGGRFEFKVPDEDISSYYVGMRLEVTFVVHDGKLVIKSISR